MTLRACTALALAVAATLGAPHTFAADPPPAAAPDDDPDFARPLSDPPRTPTPAMVKRSVELYNEGVAHAQAGRSKDAYFAFRDAYEQDGSAEALANAATIEVSLGRPVLAAEHLARAIARFSPERKAEIESLEKRLAEVKKGIGTIVITVPDHATAEIDGVWVGSGPFTRTCFVWSGAREVTVTGYGGSITRRSDLKKGEQLIVNVTQAQLQANAAAARALPAPGASPVASSSASPTLWILGGTALAMGAAGGVGLGVYLRNHDIRVKIEEQTRALGGRCGTSPSPGFVDDCGARDDAAGNETIGTVIAIAGFGALGAIGTGVLFVALTERAPAQPSVARAATDPAPRLTLSAGPGGVMLHGEF